MNTLEIKLMEFSLEKNETMAEAKMDFTRKVREARQEIKSLENVREEVKKINKLIDEFKERRKTFKKDPVVAKEFDDLIKEQEENKKTLFENEDAIDKRRKELQDKITEYNEDYALEVMQIDNRYQRRKLEYLKEKEIEKANV